MTPKGKERLLKLAEILDVADAEHRKNKEPTYNQHDAVHECGTPACALGHYAAANPRRFKLGTYIEFRDAPKGEDRFSFYVIGRAEFGLTEEQVDELFDYYGCGSATTAKQAARYIRKFVARVEREQNDAVEAYRRKIEAGEVIIEEAA